ncbi:MAG: serine hydrolase [Pseudomonadota bacterium]
MKKNKPIHTLKACAAAAAFLLQVQGADAGTPELGAAVFPAASWEAAPASSLDTACRKQLNQARELLQAGPATALLAVQDGRILFSYGPVDRVSIVESVRKSILAMLYGRYVADGSVDLDKTLAEIGIDDVGGLLPLERQARLRDVLAARSGVYHPAANSGDDTRAAPPRGSQAPGSYFLYNNWDFNAAGGAFEMLTRRNIYQVFEDELAQPMQLQDFHRYDPRTDVHRQDGDSTRSRFSPYHFFLSTRDMARIGYLMLHKGNWQGKQLVPAQWIESITTPVTVSADMHPASAVAHRLDYGYMWWIFDEPPGSPLQGAYMAWGLHGQYILVAPARRMVIALKREVPVMGSWNVPRVREQAFLAVARTLANAPCQ